MFEQTSRYMNLANKTIEVNKKKITYKARRFLPKQENEVQLNHITVKDGERLDTIAANVLGDPLRFWKIADSNQAMHPAELTAEIGRVLNFTNTEM